MGNARYEKCESFHGSTRRSGPPCPSEISLRALDKIMSLAGFVSAIYDGSVLDTLVKVGMACTAGSTKRKARSARSDYVRRGGSVPIPSVSRIAREMCPGRTLFCFVLFLVSHFIILWTVLLLQNDDAYVFL